MTKQAKVSVSEVGQAYGCEAKVYSVSGRRTVHTTRTYPYGSDAVAYAAAETWATEHGYTVADDDGGMLTWQS